MAHTSILFDKGKKNGDFGRLHVGYRASDWTKTWYQPAPDAEPDEDGTIAIGLFKFSSGGPSRREPMEGEVVWLPHFNPKQFKSTKNVERERLHKQFIHDAWRYLAERDSDQVRQMEQELDNPYHRQWQSWFEEAKKWKSSRVRGRGKRRTSRLAVLVGAGIEDAEQHVNSDTSDDSAYESESELFVREKRKPGENVDVPPAKKSTNKQPKASPGDKLKGRSRDSDQGFPIRGSVGGLRRQLGGSLFDAGQFGSRTNIPRIDNSGEDEEDNASPSSHHSQIWDNRSPEPSHRSASRNGSASNHSRSGQRAADEAAMREKFKQRPRGGGSEEARAREANGDMGENQAIERALRESSFGPGNRSNGVQSNNPNGANGASENEG